MTITQASLDLFLELARDADNWSGTPLITVSPASRGNLTQLKRAKLLTTFTSDGCAFARFTDTGRALAKEHGVEV